MTTDGRGGPETQVTSESGRFKVTRQDHGSVSGSPFSSFGSKEDCNISLFRFYLINLV